MVEEILAFDLVLRHPALRGQLGQENVEQAGVRHATKSDRGLRRDQELLQLRRDPLAGDVRGQSRVLADRGEGRRLDRELEDRGESHGPHHPQRVLGESRSRVADGTQRPPLDVRDPVERIDEAILHLVRLAPPGDGVHREVAPRQVEPDVVAELDPMRPPEIGVVMVGPERRHLVGRRALADGDGPELVLVDGAREDGEQPIRAGVGREVPVLRRPAEQRIAHRAAHDVRRVPVRPEALHQRGDGRGDRDRDGALGARHAPRLLVAAQEQVVAPGLVAVVREVGREHRVQVAARLERRAEQPHASFLGRLAALPVVARLAGGDEVVP